MFLLKVLVGFPASGLREFDRFPCTVLGIVWGVCDGLVLLSAWWTSLTDVPLPSITVTGFSVESRVLIPGSTKAGLPVSTPPQVNPGLFFLPCPCLAMCVCGESSPLAVKYCMVLSVCNDGGTLETTSAKLGFSGRGLGCSITISCSSQESDKSGEQSSSIPGEGGGLTSSGGSLTTITGGGV